jgi:hypothetical protein
MANKMLSDQRNKLLLVGFITLLVGIVVYISHEPAKTTLNKPKTTTYSSTSIPKGGHILLTQKGQGDFQTDQFVASRSWHLYWNFICYSEDYSKTKLDIDVLSPDNTSTSLSPIRAVGISGYGDQPYQEPGTYKLKIQTDTKCKWQVTAKTT